MDYGLVLVHFSNFNIFDSQQSCPFLTLWRRRAMVEQRVGLHQPSLFVRTAR